MLDKITTFFSARSIPSSSDCQFLRPSASQEMESLAISKNQSQQLYASIAYGDTYVQPLILSALASRLPEGLYMLLSSESTLPGSKKPVLHIKSYEELPFDDVMAHPETCLVNAYIIRKALVRTQLISVSLETSLYSQDPKTLSHNDRQQLDSQATVIHFGHACETLMRLRARLCRVP